MLPIPICATTKSAAQYQCVPKDLIICYDETVLMSHICKPTGCKGLPAEVSGILLGALKSLLARKTEFVSDNALLERLNELHEELVADKQAISTHVSHFICEKGV